MISTSSEVAPSSATASRPNDGILLFCWRWFWRITLVVSLPITWYYFYVPSNNVAWAANATTAQEQSAQSGKPVILFFTGKWCVPCRIMKRNVWADEQVTSIVNAGFIPVTVDVDDPESTETRNRYNVGYTPNTIIVDTQGNVLQQRAGGLSKAEFLELIDQVKSPTTQN